MFEGYRVVSVTPAGRRKYLDILSPYLLRGRGLIDSHEWWVNTTDEDDIAYMHSLSDEHPDFFTTVEVEAPCPPSGGHRNGRLAHFYPRCVDPHTIYIKLDDDICYIARDAVAEILQFRIDNPQYFLIYANTINSPLNTHIHQRMGALPASCEFVHYNPAGNGWDDPNLAALVHEAFLSDLQDGRTDRWRFERWEMPQPERFSINFCAWFGADLGIFEGRVEGDDEYFLACGMPAHLNRRNAVCGRSLVSHFAFWPQREALEQRNLLERYHRHAEMVCRSERAPGDQGSGKT